MTLVLLDTHALIWYLSGSDRLSQAAVAAINESLADGHRLLVSSISIVEVTYLAEKGRLDARQLPSLLDALRRPDANMLVQPFDIHCAEALGRISRDSVPDMPDRMIAATALYLSVPLITRDSRIQASNVRTIW